MTEQEIIDEIFGYKKQCTDVICATSSIDPEYSQIVISRIKDIIRKMPSYIDKARFQALIKEYLIDILLKVNEVMPNDEIEANIDRVERFL